MSIIKSIQQYENISLMKYIVFIVCFSVIFNFLGIFYIFYNQRIDTEQFSKIYVLENNIERLNSLVKNLKIIQLIDLQKLTYHQRRAFINTKCTCLRAYDYLDSKSNKKSPNITQTSFDLSDMHVNKETKLRLRRSTEFNQDSTLNAAGIKGEPGIIGPPGPPGPPGIPGQQGIDGYPGTNGQPGAKGEKGNLGLPGSVGLKGERGRRGNKGEPGDMGQSGSPGLPGPQGPQGQIGEPGNRGALGEIGPQGISGLPGFKGDQGAPGIPGLPGLTGKTGPKGESGSVGLPGPPGGSSSVIVQNSDSGEKMLQGPPGPQGPPGNTGLPGSKGEPGVPGINGVKGTKGEQGIDGIGMPGPPGPYGKSGLKGDKGNSGKDGAMGPMGPPGPSGRIKRGKRGRKGDPGKPGAPGLNGKLCWLSSDGTPVDDTCVVGWKRPTNWPSQKSGTQVSSLEKSSVKNLQNKVGGTKRHMKRKAQTQIMRENRKRLRQRQPNDATSSNINNNRDSILSTDVLQRDSNLGGNSESFLGQHRIRHQPNYESWNAQTILSSKPDQQQDFVAQYQRYQQQFIYENAPPQNVPRS